MVTYQNSRFQGSDTTAAPRDLENNFDELWVIEKVISFVNGYDHRPLFTQISRNDLKFTIGTLPNLYEINTSTNLRLPTTAIKTLLKEFGILGTAAQLLYKLQAKINENSIRNGRLPKSLLSLLETTEAVCKEQCTPSKGSINQLDWGFDEYMPGFFEGLRLILNDWRAILFEMHTGIVKNTSENMAANTQSRMTSVIITPVMGVYNDNLSIFARIISVSNGNLSLLALYTILKPYMKLMHSLMELIETFLYKLSLQEKCDQNVNKSDRSNLMNGTMIMILLISSREAEMARDTAPMKLWKFLLFYTLNGCKNSIIEIIKANSLLSSSFSFNIKTLSDIKRLSFAGTQVDVSMDHYLGDKLSFICDYNAENTEIAFLKVVDEQLRLNIDKNLNYIRNYLETEFRYYIIILDHLSLFKFNKLIDPFIEYLDENGIYNQFKIAELLFNAITKWKKYNQESALIDISDNQLLKILSSFKIVKGEDSFNIFFNEKNLMLEMLLSSDCMKLYSLIFVHMKKYCRFISLTRRVLLEYEKTRESMPFLLLLIHIYNALNTYYSSVLCSTGDVLSKINNSMGLSDISSLCREHLLDVTKVLFVHTGCKDRLFYGLKSNESLVDVILNIFKVPEELLFCKGSIHELYMKLKEYIETMKELLQSYTFVDISPANISILKDLLTFNDRDRLNHLTF